MRIILLLSLVFSTYNIFAQTTKGVELWADNYNNKVKFLNNNKYDQIIGSPYFNENYTEVEVGSIGKVAEKLRYNAVTDKMEFEKNDVIYNSDPLLNENIIFNNGIGPIYKFIDYKFSDGANQGYTIVLVDGPNYKLLKRQIKFLKNTSKNSQINQRDATFEIDTKPVEYILETDGKFYKFPKNNKALEKVLGSKKSAEYKLLENYNFSNEKDIIQLVEEINK